MDGFQPLSAGDGESYTNDKGDRFILTAWFAYKLGESDERYSLRIRETGRTMTGHKIIYFHNPHDNIGLRMGDERLTIKKDILEYRGNEYRLDSTVRYIDTPPDIPDF